MAFFSPKTWKQRIVEFPGRRRLDDTSTADVYDVSRAEGTITQEGDGFTAVNMNDLEQRINNAVNDVAGLNAEEYDPKSTYKKGALRTHNNALWKAKENIDTPEQWTPEHWDSTTIAKELEENRDASKVTYNNESSGLTAQTVQEAIDENAEAISALNSSYGTNENGSYLRMPDGTQICWLNITVTDQTINTVYANGIYIGSRTWTFPMPFISTPTVSCGAFMYGTSASWGSISGTPSVSNVTLRGYDVVSREAGQKCIIQAIAIGRWKS